MNDYQKVKRELDGIYPLLDGKKLILYPFGKLGRITEYILAGYGRTVDIYIDQRGEDLGENVFDRSVLDDLDLSEYALLSASYLFSYEIVQELREKYGDVEGFSCYNLARNLPREVNIGITNKCNLSCSFCINKNMPKESLETEAVFRVIDQCARAGVGRVCIMGHGEPLVHPDFVKIMGYLAQQPFDEKCFYTNGYGLKGKIADEIARLPLSRMYVSLTGFADDVFGQMQGYGRDAHSVRTQIYQNINDFLKLVNKNGSGLKTTLVYILKDEYVDDLNKYIEYWEPRVDEIEIRGLVHYDKISAKTEKARCGLLGNVLGVDHNGAISPCCLGGEKRGSVDIPDLGNINKGEGLDVLLLESDELQRLFAVNAKAQRSEFPEQCKRCTYLTSDPFHNFYFGYRHMKSLRPLLEHIREEKCRANFYGATPELAALLTLARIDGVPLDCVIYDDEAEVFGSYAVNKTDPEQLKGRRVYLATHDEEKLRQLLIMKAIPVRLSDFQEWRG